MRGGSLGHALVSVIVVRSVSCFFVCDGGVACVWLFCISRLMDVVVIRFVS